MYGSLMAFPLGITLPARRDPVQFLPTGNFTADPARLGRIGANRRT
jgi:hypothetical protein